jgi:hypothetical protein
MFNITKIVINAFVAEVEGAYRRVYGRREPDYPEILGFIARLALENIANSDAPYHDVEHTIMVALAGQEILHGKHLREGGVKPRDWLHFTASLLCHDIGYVRGVCKGDRGGQYVTGVGDGFVRLPPGATDASLTPHHVNRSKLFVRERFANVSPNDIDTAAIEANIEHTRFPVPETGDYAATSDYPGLVRAADLIGQLADLHYLRKMPALVAEFLETGASEKLGYKNPAEMRSAYPGFFKNVVTPYIGDALRYLQVTQDGKEWMAHLYAHVFSEEHRDAPVI